MKGKGLTLIVRQPFLGPTMHKNTHNHFLHFHVVRCLQNAFAPDASTEILGNSKFPEFGKSGIWNLESGMVLLGFSQKVL